MGQYHVRGFSLEQKDAGENEIQLTIFTNERGKIRVSVRGTKKPGSTLRPALIPLTEGHFFLTERRTTDLLTEWTPLHSYSAIKNDAEKLAFSGYASHFILTLVPFREPDESIYYLLKNIFHILLLNIKHDIIKVLYEWGFLRIAGIAPAIDSCAGCGSIHESGNIWWNISDGNIYCQSCSGKSMPQAMQLSLESIKFGNKIDMSSGSLFNRSFGKEGNSKSFDEAIKQLSTFNYEDRIAFGKAVVRFCQYHLNEEIAGWQIKI